MYPDTADAPSVFDLSLGSYTRSSTFWHLLVQMTMLCTYGKLLRLLGSCPTMASRLWRRPPRLSTPQHLVDSLIKMLHLQSRGTIFHGSFEDKRDKGTYTYTYCTQNLRMLTIHIFSDAINEKMINPFGKTIVNLIENCVLHDSWVKS